MSSVKKMLNLLLSGQRVGTDNKTCSKLSTNQVPDVARRLRAKGINVESEAKSVKRHGKTVVVSEYFLSQAEIQRLQSSAAA